MVLVGGCWLLFVTLERRTIVTLDCGSGRRIRISMYEPVFEPPYPVYDVWDTNGKVVDEHFLLDLPDDPDDLTYKVLLTQDRQIAGVVSDNDPYEVFILHDFASDESWPRDDNYGADNLVVGWRKRQALRERLEKDHPEIGVDAKLTDKTYLAGREYLDLSDSRVTGKQLAHLRGYPRLTYLNLTNTTVSDRDMVHVGTLTQLTGLSLWHTKITDEGLKHLAGLQQLESLNLSNTRITEEGLAHLANFPKLSWLDLPRDLRITDRGVLHLSRLRSLEALDLRNAQITDDSLRYLSDMEELWSLCLMGSTITDDALIHVVRIPKLRDLGLSRCAITDAGLLRLKSFPSLASVSLWDTNLSDAAVAELQAAKPNLTIYRSVAERKAGTPTRK